MNAVILKKGKESILVRKHHWIFSGAIYSYPPGYEDGDLVPIHSYTDELLGYGFFKRGLSLAGRVVSFDKEEVFSALRKTLLNALKLREAFTHSQTTAYRLINGEGDGFPGLIVDRYGPYLVTQTGALGMRKLLPWLVGQFKELLPIKGIYDKSASRSLKEEGIDPQEKILWGEIPDQIEILEEGIRFNVSIIKGQKTGFFLDQREMRRWVSENVKGKRVLNGFCYTGGFTLSALKGGAAHVDSVDISQPALELCHENVALNEFQLSTQGFYASDLFAFLEERECSYDLVILDPPAFAKRKKDIPAASKAYRRLFRLALKKMSSSALLLLSSCSHHISEELFEALIREAALDAGRTARIIGRHRLAYDHPINLFHPESTYLKSLILYVS